jgi:hypothetical protein
VDDVEPGQVVGAGEDLEGVADDQRERVVGVGFLVDTDDVEPGAGVAHSYPASPGEEVE